MREEGVREGVREEGVCEEGVWGYEGGSEEDR